ncbi:helix-turn-helix domain-containing protein [Konateibacter massiliensis]|uniref:helix-turn-helix domain-containing protein n=1 Tax=Konateibacter massiliensis TaxID=2002841 RepID=UPI000C1546A7|nr:helix-turn-helix domain-containing protein [Konateibacter massiliensis]
MSHKKKNLPLKTVYYRSFIVFTVLPILVVLVIALSILNIQFKKQAIENIERAQENVITNLKADIDTMSMRLSHIVYTNNNEILQYASETDTSVAATRYENEQRLSQSVNMALEPVKEIVSVGFYMKDGINVYVKRDINREIDEIKKSSWYQEALEKSNQVCVGSYDTKSTSDLFNGGKKDLLILVFAIAPDVKTDRSQKIEMVTFYQSTKAAERIGEYNKAYLAGKNKLGMTRITDADGTIIFSTSEEEPDYKEAGYTSIKTPIAFNNTQWIIESYIKTKELTSDYWETAMLVLGTAVLILLFAGYYFGYFLKGIVKPVEVISQGLKQVEEGKLDIHIEPSGQYEIRSMIHQFNAMVRRLKALIEDYEERVRNISHTPSYYLGAMIKGEMTPEEVNETTKEFFMEGYAIIGLMIDRYSSAETETKCALRVISSFERNPRFASRCVLHMESAKFLLVFYRITETDYKSNIIKMIDELQKIGAREADIHMFACIGSRKYGCQNFESAVNEIKESMCLCHLKKENGLIYLEDKKELYQIIIKHSFFYEKLAEALYIADEKNSLQEREKLFELFANKSMEESKAEVYAVITAIGKRFNRDNSRFSDVFGQPYDYMEKMDKIEDVRSLRLWITNYFTWIIDFSASKLNIMETDVIVKAKRFMSDHYEEADLSLAMVADYVGLNEKYFTNRFTKETGETFSSYLTELRIQKAKELLKTTNFKIYEVAQMSGYHNVEHFNRMFKKLNQISPAQYRKTM